jgi:tetratricopeptide (TPR) repeat protein
MSDTLFRTALVLRASESSNQNRQAACSRPVSSLRAQYDRMGGLPLLRKALEIYREMTSANRSHHDTLCHQLAMVFYESARLTNSSVLLYDAIGLFREVLSMQPKGHMNRAWSCHHLARALRVRNEQTGKSRYLEEIVQLHREALALRPDGKNSWHLSCHNLSLSLRALYKHTGQYAHLEEAIRLREQALDLRPKDHPHRAQTCSQLALELLTQFRYTGDGRVLDRAIGLHRKALDMLPDGHPFLYASYRALGRSLVARFAQTGDYAVLKETTDKYRQALALTHKGHPSRYWSCVNLAGTLRMLFRASTQAVQPSPLVEAIELDREALNLHSAAQGRKDRSYYNLAESLSLRFSETRVDAIGREALQFHQKALTLRPEGHRQRNMSCYALAKCLRGLFPEDRGSKVLELFNEALRLGTPADPLCWRILLGRAEVLLSLNRHESAVADLYNVLSSPKHDIPELLTESLKLLARVSLDRLSLIRQRILLRAYSSALDLLFVSIGFALDLGSQLQRASDATDAGARAFAISLRVGDLPAGLAVLERARGVIWSQALQVRDPQLDGVPLALQKRLRTILRATSLAQSDEWDSEDVESSLESETFLSTQDVLHQRHTQLQQVISEIRALPGLFDFMRGPNVPALLATASKNPVVMLIANGSECHALVIRSSHEPMVAIPLDISTKALQELILTGSVSIRGAPASSESIEDSQRAMHISRRMSASHTTLAKIWRAIVQPVITHLQLVVRYFHFSR